MMFLLAAFSISLSGKPAPVEHLDYEKVNYWPEFTELITEATKSIPSTLGLCWGGFALAYLLGIPKENFAKKLFGVYELDNLSPSNPIIGALDDKFLCPQSRFAGLPDKEMENAASKNIINLLACLLYTSPSPRDKRQSRMPSSA